MWYIGNNSNEYGLKYGDEVEIHPVDKSCAEANLIGVHILNLRTRVGHLVYLATEELVGYFTIFARDVQGLDTPKRVGYKKHYFYCPTCGTEVNHRMSICTGCYQTLDWEELDCSKEGKE